MQNAQADIPPLNPTSCVFSKDLSLWIILMFFDLHNKQHWTSLDHHIPWNICCPSLFLFTAKNFKRAVYISCFHFSSQSQPKPETLALLSQNHLPQMTCCKISMMSLQFNGQSSLFILFNSPGALDTMGYSFLSVTLLFLDIEAQLFPSSSPFRASDHLWVVLRSLCLSCLYLLAGWSHLLLRFQSPSMPRNQEATYLPCTAFPSFRLDQQITKLTASTWMPLPDKIESITFPWNHFSTNVLYIHI